MLGSFRDDLGLILILLLDDFVIMFGWFWDDLGMILGPFGHHYWINLGPIPHLGFIFIYFALFQNTICLAVPLPLFFPQHLCSGSPFLPSLSALGRMAGIWVPPPPRATRTALLLLLLLLLLLWLLSPHPGYFMQLHVITWNYLEFPVIPRNSM